MKSTKNKEIAECMQVMEYKVAVWSTVKVISNYLNDNEITYDQFLDAVALIDHYTHHEAELMSCEVDEEIDLNGEDGGWFTIPAIG